MEAVKFHDFSSVQDEQMRFVVSCARYNGKWVFCRHKERFTWELPGGRREPGETVMQAMRRELWEETGAMEAEITPVCAYSVTKDTVTTYGALFYAQIRRMEALPRDFEIGEVELLDHMPQMLTYPHIQPQLYDRIQGWINLQSSPDELWDVYDQNRKKTGKLHKRGVPLQDGEYHLVVHVWILDREGKFLLTKRSPNKGFPNMWESTGGSALAGDDSLTAALREVKEEMGLILDPGKGSCVLSCAQRDYFRDVWLFRQDFAVEDVVLQPGETIDKQRAAAAEILALLRNGQLVPYDYLEELFAKAELTF